MVEVELVQSFLFRSFQTSVKPDLSVQILRDARRQRVVHDVSGDVQGLVPKRKLSWFIIVNEETMQTSLCILLTICDNICCVFKIF